MIEQLRNSDLVRSPAIWGQRILSRTNDCFREFQRGRLDLPQVPVWAEITKQLRARFIEPKVRVASLVFIAIWQPYLA